MKTEICSLVLLAAATALACGCGDAPVPAVPDGSGPAGPCGAAAADGVAVTETDIYGGAPFALGYPPYAIDGCKLAYVRPPESGAPAGRLVLRDLGTLGETVLAEADEKPRRPTVAGEVVAWEATLEGKRAVRVWRGGEVATLAGPFDHTGEPRAAPDAVAFTGWKDEGDAGDTDVFLYLPASGEVLAIAVGPGQQRFADVSTAHVAYSDFSEDADGTFGDDGSDLADIGVFDRATSTSILRARTGKQAFPMLGEQGKLAYLDWGLVHPEPKFSAYELLLGDVDGPTSEDVLIAEIVTSQPYIRPTARGTLVEWVQWPPGEDATLWRRPSDLSVPEEIVPGLEGLELFGPSASDRTTVLAGRQPGGEMALQAIAR